MKYFYILLLLAILSCKKKDDCDIQYVDSNNVSLPKDVCIYYADSSIIQIINASCKKLNINEYSFDIDGPEIYYLPSRTIQSGAKITYAVDHLDFKITNKTKVLHLKHHGKLVSSWYFN